LGLWLAFSIPLDLCSGLIFYQSNPKSLSGFPKVSYLLTLEKFSGTLDFPKVSCQLTIESSFDFPQKF
jgi:hypothetical protein